METLDSNHNNLRFFRLSDNLVWYCNLKAASTYFDSHFVKIPYKKIKISDINLSVDTIFGHIIDPYEKREKGIAEFLTMHNIDSIVINNEELYQLFCAPAFDEHSVPITVLLGDFSKKIKWIPIDQPKIDYMTLTKDLLKKHNVEINFLNGLIHKSDDNKKHVKHIIHAHFCMSESKNPNNVIEKTFKKDFEIYYDAIQKIENGMFFK